MHAWLQAGAVQGFTVAEIESALARIADEPRAKEFLVVDPDADLARILALEVSEALGYAVPSASFEEPTARTTKATSVLALPAQVVRAKKELKAGSYVPIVVRSMEDLLAGYRRPEASVLIGLVSRSESIRRWSSTLLSALGFPPDSVLLRSPGTPQWKRGLTACQWVAADVEAFEELPDNLRGRVMRVMSPDFLTELQTSKRSA